MRLEPRPRVVDWAILLALGVALATGLGTLFAGAPGDWWVLALHGVAGLALLAPLSWKLRRERRHLDPRRWSRRTAGSLLLSALAVAAVGTGLAWTLGVDLRLAAWSGLVVHAVVGLLLVPPLLGHLVRRFRVPRRADFEGRRSALQAGVLVAGSLLAWRGGRAAGRVLAGVDGLRRYTGSRAAGGAGNDFPVTSWVADDPAPVDAANWRVSVGGAVARPRTFALADLDAGDDRSATLDCTSGWYAERTWRGVRLGTLLDGVEPHDDAHWVSLHSVTGYRFALPMAEARDALLATHVGGERLTHGHGFPLRLVAPGRRGYQWVKWVTAVEVRRSPDYGQWWAIFASGVG